jgi:NAD dependent epimerase/dehydratase family.
MLRDVKKVFIFGGTGFLGYYSALLFLKKGIAVDTLALPVKDDKDLSGVGDWFPKEIGLKYGNLFEMTKEELTEVLKGYDAMIYAVGPDDRVIAPAPAYNFFREKLVDKVVPVFEAAKDAGVKHSVLLSSYFCYFDRTYPERKLSEHHSYIRVRNEQATALINVGSEDTMTVSVLELPYIFGAMPERMPLWKEVFLDRFEKMPACFFTTGGTTMIHVTGIAEAVVAATLNGKHGVKYPIGNKNVKFTDMFKIINDEAGVKKKVLVVPTWMAAMGGAMIDKKFKKEGKQGGLDHKLLMYDIQSKYYYYDAKPVWEQLGYDELGFNGGLGIIEGIADTVRACYPERYDADGKLKPEWVIPENKKQYKGPKI